MYKSFGKFGLTKKSARELPFGFGHLRLEGSHVGD
jgi:hypothetical protein